MIFGARELFVLDPSVAHLNHGSFGAIPIAVREARRELLDEFDANPLRFVTGNLDGRTEVARFAMAEFIGAEPELSVLVGNVTLAVSIVLRTLDLRSGDEIVLTDHSYNAVTLAAYETATRRGAKVVFAAVDLDSPTVDAVAAVMEQVNDRTRLVVVDQISSQTAQLHPVAAIAAELRARQVPFLVDAAHAPGMLHRPVAGIDADFWVGNMHKWAYAPSGTAVLRVAPQWRDRMVPLAVSHAQPDGFPLHLEHQGTCDFTTWLAAPAGLTLFDRFGEAEIQRHNVELAAYGQQVIGAALGVDSAALPYPGDGVSMRVIPLPPGLAESQPAATALRRRIADELATEVAINHWRGRGLLRVSAQIYNSAAEFDRLAAALPALLQAAA